jgi:hypothetical protein
MRNPYILVRLSDLQGVLNQEAIQAILKEAAKYDLNSLVDSKVIKKVKSLNSVSTDSGSINLMKQAFLAYKRRKTNKITWQTDFTLANEVSKAKATKAIKSFCTNFNIEFTVVSIQTYIEVVENIVGDKRMSIASLGSTFDKACRFYGKYKELESMDEKDKAGTKLIMEYYGKLLATKTNIVPEDTVDSMADYLYAFKDCSRYGISPLVWVDAQFEMVQAFTTFPSTYHLHGDNAIKRYSEYAASRKELKGPTGNAQLDYLRSL